MKTTNIFVSYSHNDSRWVEKTSGNDFALIPFLSESLKWNNVVFWFDHELRQHIGAEYKEKIKDEIWRAHFAVLLISQDFINSDFIRDFELPWIKERVDKGELFVVPILVGHADLESEKEFKWLTERQMLPGKTPPLIDYTADPAKWQKVRIEILQAIRKRVLEQRDPEPPPTPDKSTIETDFGRKVSIIAKYGKKMIAIVSGMTIILLLWTIFIMVRPELKHRNVDNSLSNTGAMQLLPSERVKEAIPLNEKMGVPNVLQKPNDWNMPSPRQTNIVPKMGTYTFNRQGCFQLIEDNIGGPKFLVFSRDCYRKDKIFINNGSFSHEWGEINGTHCPTDAYAISGAFVTPTRAEGVIKSGYDCKLTGEEKFIAEFDIDRRVK